MESPHTGRTTQIQLRKTRKQWTFGYKTKPSLALLLPLNGGYATKKTRVRISLAPERSVKVRQ
jgi:hypothetical protein